MSSYPDYVTATARRIADRFYRRLAQIPTPHDLDDQVDLNDRTGTFKQAGRPERRSE